MEYYFLAIVAILLILAVSGLVVGVSNDAVNFLNSAIGSKAAPRKVILIIASVGIIVGAITSSGMMEVARSGVFHPEAFNFEEIMMLFLGVMFANVILLDIFNTFGLPTSTTVSLVFGLLGAAIAAATMKMGGAPDAEMSSLSHYINSDRAMIMILGILSSVVIAFVVGLVVMFISRLIFSFNYSKVLRRFGFVWCGLAVTAILYFALFKGLKDAGLQWEILVWIKDNMLAALAITWAGATAILWLLQLAKANILKITILSGTFALALAFAGNDLVNFIGVPLAGLDAYNTAGNDGAMMMDSLNGAVKTNWWFLLVSGLIMVVTLWTSKKSKTVTETEINLAKQDEGTERFGSTIFSRSIVQGAVKVNRWYEDHTPKRIQKLINSRFTPLAGGQKAHFDLIRACVNLTTASILIAMATSLKLPLSTTYVTFMVAMGSSLADKAWGRESAVYRITGVITVIAGWFLTAFVAFVLAMLLTYALLWGKIIAVAAVSAFAIFMFIRSSVLHKKRVKKHSMMERNASATEGKTTREVLQNIAAEISDTISVTTEIYNKTINATLKEDGRTLREMVRESNDLFYAARDRKYAVLVTLQHLQDNYIEAGHFYVQVVDYMSEITKALVHITRPCYDHIINSHKGMNEEQVEDLMRINGAVSDIYARIQEMITSGEFGGIDNVLAMRDELFDVIAEAIKNQLRRIKNKTTSTKASMLYLTILNETKTMVLQSRNLLKSQKYFIENQDPTNDIV